MHAATHRLSSLFEFFKKEKEKSFCGGRGSAPVKALAKEEGHAATAWGKVQEVKFTSLDFKLNVIHLSPKSDSPLRVKAVENTNKHTYAHECIVQTLLEGANPLSGQHIQSTWAKLHCSDHAMTV